MEPESWEHKARRLALELRQLREAHPGVNNPRAWRKWFPLWQEKKYELQLHIRNVQ